MEDRDESSIDDQTNNSYDQSSDDDYSENEQIKPSTKRRRL